MKVLPAISLWEGNTRPQPWWQLVISTAFLQCVPHGPHLPTPRGPRPVTPLKQQTCLNCSRATVHSMSPQEMLTRTITTRTPRSLSHLSALTSRPACVKNTRPLAARSHAMHNLRHDAQHTMHMRKAHVRFGRGLHQYIMLMRGGEHAVPSPVYIPLI